MMANKGIHWFLLAHLLVQIANTNARVPAIIVFGDSSVDAGNNNQIPTILKSNFEPYGRDFIGGQPTGRFSNGRIATDFISEAFGIKPTIPAYLDPTYGVKDFATGVCFASAGTGYDNATSNVLSVVPLWGELEYYKEYQKDLRGYLGEEKANEVLSEALYLISIGTNDFLENYYLLPERSLQFSIEEYQRFLAGIAGNFITELYNLGARKISLVGLPPMGCLPLARTTNILIGSECIEEYNNVAKDFNEKLKGLTTNLNKELTGIRLVFSNVYDFLFEMIQNPQLFGFEETATACCGTGLIEVSYLCEALSLFTCSDASKYVFWDSIHPTETTNGLLADHVMKNDLAHEFLR
ncbi:GDSL esterase/lipase At4g26790-like [Corylus avellana]|uniref:GDSL esterase/lipase At4g26790-like n=1 Tax=Corylus avellana TaxID=13451 RepID=UPI00286A7ACE|nr:GDSL esterase/lipase At4g26790-like [Corylus avellana]